MSETFEFLEGEVLLIDKPTAWTSFDVVNKVRFILKHKAGIPKIKVGHAGTLDPLATGLLVICTGKMTKKINDMQLLDKEYTGTITLGATTPSFDGETEIDQTFPAEHLNEEKIRQAARELTGTIMQLPPIFSAKKIEGKRAYKYARANREVKLEPKEVIIHEFELTRIEVPHVDFRVKCSKGTYIRSLAHDLGKKLDNGGYLSSLRRTKVGDFSIEEALNIEQFEYLAAASRSK
jgi:tRNA pseudouridine55 synthase